MKRRCCWLRKSASRFGIVLFGLLLTCGAAKAASGVVLAWNANPDPSVVGYNVYFGGTSGNYTNMFSAGDVTNTMVNGLAEGKTYYFAVTAYDAFGDESGFSAETIYIVPGWLRMTPRVASTDPVHIQFPVASGHVYQLQESTNLRNWSTIWYVTGLSNQWMSFSAPVGVAGSMYYRIYSPN
ncbi:MAG TPA: fibronectin type III domain-containing protein [Candidatus Angelobacter sp.]|nr:fibronectin type III domain-containing protein [Candidatus Angelobacter sp.]